MSLRFVGNISYGTLVGMFALASCSQGSGPTPGPSPTPTVTACIIAVPRNSIVQLVYPEPGASAVSAGIGTLVYAAPEAESVALFPNASGNESSTTPGVATTPTSVPSPLPSPFATPESYGGPYFAVSVPALAAHTSYGVGGLVTLSGCGSTTTEYLGDSSFTTQ